MDFQKNFETFVDLFLGRSNCFLSSPKAPKRPCFGQNFCAADKILKKNRPKKAFLGTFWKIFFSKNRVFSARAPPSKLVYIGAKDAFRKIRVRHQKWVSQNSTKGGPFGSAGG